MSRVPRWILLCLAATLAMQVMLEAGTPPLAARYQPLGEPLPAAAVRGLTLGDPALASRAVTLLLQAHDTQPGYSVPLAQLDYRRVVDWLRLALALDPASQYPLLAATRIYAAVRDPPRVRTMLAFVHQAFLEDPERRWRWMAEAALAAKHRLGDLPLALRYARAITREARGPQVPAWARDMAVVVAQEMGQDDDARALIAALLHEGRVTDPNERRYLLQRLEELAPAGETQQR
jgi:hypothetical protein